MDRFGLEGFLRNISIEASSLLGQVDSALGARGLSRGAGSGKDIWMDRLGILEMLEFFSKGVPGLGGISGILGQMKSSILLLQGFQNSMSGISEGFRLLGISKK